MTQSLISLQDFSPIADGISLDTKAFEAAIKVAERQGGGHIVVPPGTYLTGPIRLISNLVFEIQAGATLLFTDDVEQFPTVDSRWEGVKSKAYMPCIYGKNLTNVILTGSGTLDGQGTNWWKLHRETPEKLAYPRPYLIGFDYSSRITISDLNLTMSPSWTVHPMECYDVTIQNISILNPADSPNTDGIDPESCKNLRILNCNIDVGDDCISIKSGTEQTTTSKSACENITISNCTMVHGHGAVVLGSEMSRNIRNVTISNCVFQQTDRGIRMKTRRGRGGVVENITVSTIVMEDVLCPFVINAYYFCGPKGKEKYVWDKNPYPITKETPCFRSIHFSNIVAKKVRAAEGFIYGLPEMPVQDVSFTNIQIEMDKNGLPGVPAMMTGIDKMQAAGFFLGNTELVQFQQVIVENIKGPVFKEENNQLLLKSNCYQKTEKQLIPYN